MAPPSEGRIDGGAEVATAGADTESVARVQAAEPRMSDVASSCLQPFDRRNVIKGAAIWNLSVGCRSDRDGGKPGICGQAGLSVAS